MRDLKKGRFVFQNKSPENSGGIDINGNNVEIQSQNPDASSDGFMVSHPPTPGDITPPEGETLESLHYKLVGYEVQGGDNLTHILRDRFLSPIDYNNPQKLNYLSTKLSNGEKPQKVTDTHKIFPGQMVYWTEEEVIIADADQVVEPFTFAPPPKEDPEEEKEPPKGVVFGKKGGDEGEIFQEGEKEPQEEKEEESSYKNKPKNKQKRYYHSFSVEGEAEQTETLEKKFQEQNREIPKDVVYFLSKNSITVQPQHIYINKDGLAAIPCRKNTVGGLGEVVRFTLFVDGYGHQALYDENVDPKKEKREGETLQEMYDMAVYNTIIDREIKRNREHNVGLEDIDHFLTDDDLREVLQVLAEQGAVDIFPVSRDSQKKFRSFVKFWIHKASRESYTGGGKEKVSKIMKRFISRGDYQSSWDRTKIRNLVREYLFP